MKIAKYTILTGLLLAALLSPAVHALEASKKADPAAVKSETITIKPGNMFIVTDGKDLQQVLAELKKHQPATKEPAKAETAEAPMTPIGFWNNLVLEVGKTFDKLSRIQALSLENLYLLLGGLFCTFLAVVMLRRIFDRFLLRCLAWKTATDLDDKLCAALRPPLELIVYAVGVYLSALRILLAMPHPMAIYAGRLCYGLIVFAFAWATFRSVEIFAEWVGRYAGRHESRVDTLIVNLLQKTLKAAVVIVAALFIGQSVLGLNLTTLLAGAGIFSLAVAFAAQDTIANVFGSVMIVLDKPFFVGDRIKVEGIDGTVVNVGFRSTRMQTLDGHFITLPNKKLTESVVENISKRPYIKFVSNIGLVYSTPPEQMERAVAILKEIYDNHEGLNPDMPPRIFFNSFNDWALNIMVVTWYHPSDWAAAQAWNSGRNLEILRRFNAEGLSFAFPTNTTYLVNDDGKKFEINVDSGMQPRN